MIWIHRMARLFFVLACMVSASAWAAGGYVFDAVGDVFIVMDKVDTQRAKKNDAIASGMVINTGDKSHAVLKFEDGQVVAMQANSSFHVREYSYESRQVEKSNIVFAMLKGGMRFITGMIGQHNKAAFKLATPNATIGIRGTEFMVAMGNSPMYSQVVTGSISMTNAAGTAVFTAGQAAVVTSATALPAAISVSTIPVGTFTQLSAIPVPPATPAPAPASAASTGSTAGSSAPGGAATGGATTTTTAAATGAVTGISATTVGIGAAVAAGVAAFADSTTTTTHH